MNVHDALERYMRADDLLEAKQLVETHRETLLSDEGIAYLRKQLEHAQPGTPQAHVLMTKGRALIDCLRMSMGYAFARMFIELYPEPISAAIAEELAALKSPEEIATLAQRDPQTLSQIQRVVVANQLQNELKGELMGQAYPPGSERRVEACRVMARICDRRIDPVSWALIAGELGNAISAMDSASTEAIDECIELYEAILTHAPPDQLDLIANAHNSLGLMHSRKIDTDVAGRKELDKAQQHFAEALRHRTREHAPVQWAQTKHACGTALLKAAAAAPSRAKEALHDLLAALEVYAERGGPEASWLDAQKALETAYLTIANGNTDASVERLEPPAEGWAGTLASRVELTGYSVDEWLPAGGSLELWSELLTIERYGAAAGMPFAGFLAARRRDIADRVTDGELLWETLNESKNEILYRWRVTGDYAIEDQECLARAVRGKHDLCAVRFVARRALDAGEREAWTERLASLVPQQGEARESVIPPIISPEEAGNRVQSLSVLKTDPIQDPKAFQRASIDGVRRDRMPELYTSILVLCGLRLLVGRESTDESLAVAFDSLRRAVESARPRSEIWARAVAALGKGYLRQAAGEDDPNPHCACLAFETAAEVFSELGMTGEKGAAAFGIGNAERLVAKTPAELNRVLTWYVRALERQTLEHDPLGWADTTIAVGEVCADMFVVTRDDSAREQAEAAYERVLGALASEAAFADFSALGVEQIMIRAMAGLQHLDRQDLRRPTLPSAFDQRELRGNLLYLRPLTTARDVQLRNRFAHPERFAVRFDTEPEWVTLEAALYRGLAEHLGFWSIAGSVEGAGASRIFLLGGERWKEIALGQFDRADVILLVPSESAGVRWEIETLRSMDLFDKTLFLMPPASDNYDIEHLWKGAHRLLADQGIEAPDWDPSGLFFTLNESGKPDWKLPFGALWENELYPAIAERFGLEPPN